MRAAVLVITHILSFILGALTVVLMPLWATAAEAQTGQPQVTFGTPGPTTVPMTITWTVAPGATNHVVDGAYNDGGGYFTVVSVTSPVTGAMSYHASGAAAPGWVCVKATASGVSLEGACNGYTVPARPTTPPASTTLFISYLEPAKNLDGTPLTDLGTIRAYWSVDGSPEAMSSYPASSLTGGMTMTQSLPIPYTSGTVSVQVSAVDISGSESTRTPTITKPLGGAPNKGTITTIKITQ